MHFSFAILLLELKAVYGVLEQSNGDYAFPSLLMQLPKEEGALHFTYCWYYNGVKIVAVAPIDYSAWKLLVSICFIFEAEECLRTERLPGKYNSLFVLHPNPRIHVA